MGRRPQSNPRRGILRAVGTMVVLVVIALALVALASFLTASPAKAPTAPPPTPGPVTTPTPARPAATPTPAKSSKHKDIALGTARFSDQGAAHLLAAMHSATISGPATAAPRGRRIAYLTQRGNAYTANAVRVLDRATGETSTIGYGDRFIPPVWSSTGRSFVYVRVVPASGIPGDRWTLVQVNAGSGRGHVISRVYGLNVIPLGWSQGAFLFLRADAVNTSILRVAHGRTAYQGLLASQIVTGASLAPNGRRIAYATGTNCGYCTVDLVSLYPVMHHVPGPIGMPNDGAMAWTPNSSTVVGLFSRHLLAINAATGQEEGRYRLPAGLPAQWHHSLRLRLSRAGVTLIDAVKGRRYWGRRER